MQTSVFDQDGGASVRSASSTPCRIQTCIRAGCEPVYDLRRNGPDSDGYFADVRAFSSRVQMEIEQKSSLILDGYASYATQELREEPRSRGEYAIEFLTLGTMLRLYGQTARRTPGWVIDVATELYLQRHGSPRVKPLIDWMRAGLFQIAMPEGGFSEDFAAGYRGADELESATEHALAELPKLLEWLQATGEFMYESMRLDNWRSYLNLLPQAEARGWLGIATGLFDWFQATAEIALGRYTEGVGPFLENEYARRFWREDRFFCGRQRVEYHLGMVAAEIMNAGLREDFAKKPRRVVLVPACMRGAHADRCKAKVRGVDMACTGCDPQCNVSRITKRMGQLGVRVYIVPHSASFSRWLKRWQDDTSVGVVAVACMLNILAGGYEMRDRRIASQCVPLDFPGCRKHWAKEDVPTEVNEQRLVQILTGSNG